MDETTTCTQNHPVIETKRKTTTSSLLRTCSIERDLKLHKDFIRRLEREFAGRVAKQREDERLPIKSIKELNAAENK